MPIDGGGETSTRSIKSEGYIAPYTNWDIEVKTTGDYIIKGKDTKIGWQFIYEDGLVREIISPVNNKLQFIYQSQRLIAIAENGLRFIAITYTGRNSSLVQSVTINGITTELEYSDQDVRILPDKIQEGKSLEALYFTTPMLGAIKVPELAPQIINYDQ